MKKSSFIAMTLWTISGVLFAIGMCMALITEWNAFNAGIILGAAGIVLAIITLLARRKMENKAPIKVSGKTIGAILLGIAGALALGVGMCFSMVWGRMAIGIVIGLIGIMLLLMLIPLIKGIED